MVIKLNVSENCGTDSHDGCKNEDYECECPCHQGRAYMAYDFKSMLREWIGFGLIVGLVVTVGSWHGIWNGIEKFSLGFGVVFFVMANEQIRWISKLYPLLPGCRSGASRPEKMGE